MGDALHDKKFYSAEEYLLFEETAEEKHEYENGEIFAMSGGSYRHGLIAGNFLRRLQELLDSKNCTAVGSDVKVDAAEHKSYVYPDAMVICGRPEFAAGRQDVVRNPVLIVEVLSDSTESYDRGRKFKKYQSLPAFREYVLVSQTEPVVETYFRQDDHQWLYTLTEGMDATIRLQTIDSQISLGAIYQKADWQE